MVALAICARVLEESYLHEWLAFHRLAGVGAFYLFDDGSREAVKTQPDVFVWPVSSDVRSHDAQHGEHGHRDECIRVNPARAEWLAFIDADEYLYPSAGHSLVHHLRTQCEPDAAFAMVRWHMFGSAGRSRSPDDLLTIEAFVQRAAWRDCGSRVGCYSQKAGGPVPLAAKLLVRARCVQRLGTHYVTRLKHTEACRANYGLGSKHATPLNLSEHESCGAALHLNHYSVRARADYVHKFVRGRISSRLRETRGTF